MCVCVWWRWVKKRDHTITSPQEFKRQKSSSRLISKIDGIPFGIPHPIRAVDYVTATPEMANEPNFLSKTMRKKKKKRLKDHSTQYELMRRALKQNIRLTRTLTSMSPDRLPTLLAYYSFSIKKHTPSIFALWCRLFCMPRWWKIRAKVDPAHFHAPRS